MEKRVTTFQECADAGNPILESYPRQCRSKDGQTFVEEIGENENVVCTMDAKTCPDGSYVGRVPPGCEFVPCPGEINRN